MLDVDVPVVFVEGARQLLFAAKHHNRTPKAFEITFGEDAMEILGRDVLRSIFAVTALDGVPVSFPEEPGRRPLLVEFKLLVEDGGLQHGIHAALIAASY